jgi:hypothetical protein
MGSIAERQTALNLMKEAARANGDADDESYHAMVAHLAIGVDDNRSFREAVEALTSKHPRTAAAHYFAAIAAAMDERWEHAEDEIREAERLGLPREAAESFLATGVHSRANVWRYARYTAYLLVAWAVGLLLLFVAGRLLSSRMLLSIERTDPTVLSTDAERSLRSIYRTLINCAGAYHASLPFVVVLVLGGAAAVVWVRDDWPSANQTGGVPRDRCRGDRFQNAAVLVHQGCGGRARTRARAGRSASTLELAREVAQSVGTRAVDEIRITPGTEMVVMSAGARASDGVTSHAASSYWAWIGQRFSTGRIPRRARTRNGHFAHRDTAGGDVALRVRRDITMFAIALYQQGQAVWWNLAFQFLRYDFLFRRISHGAIRLQEVLADRMAAHVYGPAAFEEGLRHVIARSVEFETAVNMELNTQHKRGAPCTTSTRCRHCRRWRRWRSRRQSRTLSHVRQQRTIRILVRQIVFGW